MDLWEKFTSLDIRMGRVVEVKRFLQAGPEAYCLIIGLGEEVGVRQAVTPLAKRYSPEQLLGKSVATLVNLPTKIEFGIEISAVVLGVDMLDGLVLLRPDVPVPVGSKIL